MAKLLIGVDFGTSNIKVSKWNEKRKQVTMLKLDKIQLASNRAIPNIIGYKDTGKIVGEMAKSYSDENKVQFIKRKLELEKWETKIAATDKTLTAIEIAEDIFKWIFDEIKSKSSEDTIEGVIITAPVCYSEVQKERIRKAAEKANIKVEEVITEPVAAIFSDDEYFEKESEETILVFDFGGGTLDLSLISIENDEDVSKVTVLSSAGIKLGGVDITNLIIEEILTPKIPEIVNEYYEQKVFTNDMFSLVENKKIELFNDDESDIELEFTSPKGNNIQIEITKKEIHQIFENKNYKKDILDTIEKLIDDARIDKEDITKVKLVGGSSQIDYFKNMLYEYFEEDDDILDINDIDQDDIYNAVSEGATKLMVKKQSLNFIFENRIAFSLGCEEQERFEPILNKNSKYGYISPKKSLKFSDLKTDDTLKIYQLFEREKNIRLDNEKVIYAGKFKVDRKKYTNKEAILFELQVNKKGQVVGKFYDYTIDNKIVLVTEEILNIGGEYSEGV